MHRLRVLACLLVMVAMLVAGGYARLRWGVPEPEPIIWLLPDTSRSPDPFVELQRKMRWWETATPLRVQVFLCPSHPPDPPPLTLGESVPD
jgi:hypothetical protein